MCMFCRSLIQVAQLTWSCSRQSTASARSGCTWCAFAYLPRGCRISDFSFHADAYTRRSYSDRERHPDGWFEVFTVLGSTGNVYTVTIALTPSCDCPDGEKNGTCKHVIFVRLSSFPASGPTASNLTFPFDFHGLSGNAQGLLSLKCTPFEPSD